MSSIVAKIQVNSAPKSTKDFSSVMVDNTVSKPEHKYFEPRQNKIMSNNFNSPIIMIQGKNKFNDEEYKYINTKILYVYEMCCLLHCFIIIHYIQNGDTKQHKFLSIELVPPSREQKENRIAADELIKFNNYIKINYNDKKKKFEKFNAEDVTNLGEIIDSSVSKKRCKKKKNIPTISSNITGVYEIDKNKNINLTEVGKYLFDFLNKHPKYAYLASFCKIENTANCQTFSRYLIQKIVGQYKPGRFTKLRKEATSPLGNLNILSRITKPGLAKTKKVRKHKGIIQSGGNKGKLKKGFKYTGKRTKTGLPIIKKTK